ncbi:MAG: FtsW/RodA/SpoVE family cell cycle protein, partial [Clostridiales bacterium]|nr:FtsW/RodA/SpoVE family cell cycle protein [Clostridiales bacterium]
MFGKAKDLIEDMIHQADLVLLALCCAASAFGLLMIASATHYTGASKYVLVQGAALVIGVLLYFVISMIDLQPILKRWKWIFGFNVAFILLLLTPLGLEVGGNRAWLSASWLPMNIQPAEIVKLTFIMLLARQLVWLKDNRDLKSFSNVAMLAAHLLFMVGLIYVVSSDMGSALVYVFAFIGMAFAAGMALRWFFIGGAAAGIAFYLLWETDKIQEYMKMRFMVLFDHNLDPQGVGWHQTRSLLALGSGRLTGQGLFKGTQTQSEYSGSLPARHTDFIFSVVGEELGMIGCLLVIALLTAIILRCLVVAKNANNRADAYMCVGIASVMIFQVVENIGMCLFVMPVIGLTLPFFSYGGSSL